MYRGGGMIFWQMPCARASTCRAIYEAMEAYRNG